MQDALASTPFTSDGSPSSPHDFGGDARWHHLFYGTPTPLEVRAFASWLRSHPNDFVRLYHGTAAVNDILREGLKPTSAARRNSYQSTAGFTYLSVYPGSARAFGSYASLNRGATPEGRRIAVYPVMKTVRSLLADRDQLNNRRAGGQDVGDSLAESLVWGHGARVRGGIGVESIGAPALFSVPQAPRYEPGLSPGVTPEDDIRRVEAGIIGLVGEAAGAVLLGPSRAIRVVHSRDLDMIAGAVRRRPLDTTKSPEFKAWFGRSVATAEDGEPLVLYHGTTRDFAVFDPASRGEKTGAADARAGFFFAENPQAAEQFTWEAGEKSGHIMPAHLRLETPFISSMPLDGSNGTQAGRVLEQARALGHDGVVFENSDMLGHKGRTFVVFESTQIKSAIGNNGQYDPASPDIRFSYQSAGIVPMMSPAAIGHLLDVSDFEDALAEQARTVEEAHRKVQLYHDSRLVFDEVAWASAQAFCSTSSGQIVLIADRIAPGEEGAVFLHEIVHKNGLRVLGPAVMTRLVGQVKAWGAAPAGSLERQIHDAAWRRATKAAPASSALRAEELLAYAVEEAVLRGVRPSLEAMDGSAESWLADVAMTIQGAVHELVKGAVPSLSPQELVDLAYALAQLENPERARAIREALGDDVVQWARTRLEAVMAAPLDQTETRGFMRWSMGLPVLTLGAQGEHRFRSGQGVVVEALHGTTGDFDRFDPGRFDLESNVGAGIYTTNSPQDASINYAGFGADLKHKLQRFEERIRAECEGDDDLSAEEDVAAQAREMAGVGHDGAILPVYVRFENPVVLGGSDETKSVPDEGGGTPEGHQRCRA